MSSNGKTEKPKTTRPVVLVSSIAQARRIVAKEYTQAYADKLGDGDVLDLAMQILARDSE